MGFYDDADKEKAGAEGNRIKPGIYPALLIVNRKVVRGHHGLKEVTEYAVLEAGLKDPESDADPTPVGGTGDTTIALEGQYRKSALSESNTITGAIMGRTIDATNADLKGVQAESERAAAGGSPHPWFGRVVKARVYHKVTSNDRTMTKIVIEPWTGRMATAAELAALGSAAQPATAPGVIPTTPAPTAPAGAAAPPPPPAVAATFPPAGWTPHPSAPGAFYNTTKPALGSVWEKDLRALQASGAA